MLCGLDSRLHPHGRALLLYAGGEAVGRHTREKLVQVI